MNGDRTAFFVSLETRVLAGGPMFISSLWSSVDGEWINVFSQDTPAA